MKTRAPLLLSSLLTIAVPVFGCGGAIEPTFGSSSSSGGGGGQSPSNPAPSTPVSPMPQPAPAPAPFPSEGAWSATANGCANFTIFASHSTGRKFLVIAANKDDLGLGGLGDSASVQLGITDGPATADVSVDTFARAPKGSAPYCTDVVEDPQKPERATAIQGTATFTISSVGREGDFYAVTVTLEGVLVRAPDGSVESIPDVTYAGVGVGWLPG